MEIFGIIPARYASSRFPGKSLQMINGKSMIRRVYEQAQKAKSLSEVIVATDDQRIQSEVENFGGNVLLTSEHHKSGTDRCQEVVDDLVRENKYPDIIVNIQGDEPYIDPLQINLLASAFNDQGVQIATLVKKITSKDELFNTNINKVIFNRRKEAIYFSRHPIPFVQGMDKENWLLFFDYYKHIGLYAYRRNILREITSLEVSKLEKAESLEQLRWIDNGYKISVEETEYDSYAVDTPEDLSKFLNKS